MSTTRAIAHNTAFQITGKIISTFLGLLAIGMMTRYLGAEKFGWYVTTITFLQFVGILIDFGLIPVTAQMLSEPQFDKQKLFKNLLGFRLISAITFLAIAPLIALLFPYPMEVKIAISFTTISFLAISMNQIFTGFYQNTLKMHLQAIAENVGRLFLVVGLWFLIQQKASFIPIMITIAASSVVYCLIMWVMANKYSRASLAFDWQIWKTIIKKMWPIAISVIFNVIYLKGDTILLSLFRTQSEVGLYGAAYRVIDILAQTAMMVMGLMLPLMAYNWSRNLKEGFKKHYQQSFDAIMLLAVPVTIGLIVLSEKIMVLVAGNSFIMSGAALRILAIAVFGVFLGAIFGHTAVAINRQKQTMWIYISDAILTLAGYLIFIPKYGMYGAAWMTVFSELYAGILLWLVIRHYSQEKIQLKTFSKILFSGAIMAIAILSFYKLHVIILAVIAVVIYAALIIATRAISKETLKEILSLNETKKLGN